MLTGDKLETAVSIARSSQLVGRHQTMHLFTQVWCVCVWCVCVVCVCVVCVGVVCDGCCVCMCVCGVCVCVCVCVCCMNVLGMHYTYVCVSGV